MRVQSKQESCAEKVHTWRDIAGSTASAQTDTAHDMECSDSIRRCDWVSAHSIPLTWPLKAGFTASSLHSFLVSQNTMQGRPRP